MINETNTVKDQYGSLYTISIRQISRASVTGYSVIINMQQVALYWNSDAVPVICGSEEMRSLMRAVE